MKFLTRLTPSVPVRLVEQKKYTGSKQQLQRLSLARFARSFALVTNARVTLAATIDVHLLSQVHFHFFCSRESTQVNSYQ